MQIRIECGEDVDGQVVATLWADGEVVQTAYGRGPQECFRWNWEAWCQRKLRGAGKRYGFQWQQVEWTPAGEYTGKRRHEWPRGASGRVKVAP